MTAVGPAFGLQAAKHRPKPDGEILCSDVLPVALAAEWTVGPFYAGMRLPFRLRFPFF